MGAGWAVALRKEIRGDDGYVVVESAFTIPILVVTAMASVFVVWLAMVSLGVQDTVHSAAREVARGASKERIREVVDLWDASASISYEAGDQGVRVTVRKDLFGHVPVLGEWSMPVEHSAVVGWEAGVHSSLQAQ